MSRAPDLSAFPIPRKGGARPIAVDHGTEADGPEINAAGGDSRPRQSDGKDDDRVLSHNNDPTRETELPGKSRSLPPLMKAMPNAPTSGQVVATTVKLDENRYLRLVKAGQQGPGRLKRRTIQEMVVEAIDEWFERRDL